MRTRLRCDYPDLGLVIEQENKLKVSNRIYQSIFNEDWVKKQLLALDKKSQTPSNKARTTPPNTQQISPATPIKNEPLTQIAARGILLGLFLILPLVFFFNNVIFFNNSQPKLSQENDSLISQENDSLDSQSLSISTWCVAPIPAEEATQEDWRLRLELAQQRLQEQFPDNCQSNLDKLLVQLNPSNYEFYQDYQLALVAVARSDYQQALEQLYQAAEKAIIVDKAALRAGRNPPK